MSTFTRSRASRQQHRPTLRGSLFIVGTGIAVGQITVEALAHIRNSDCLLAVVNNVLALEWLRRLNPKVESLQRFYAPSKPRMKTYEEMVDYTMQLLRAGRDVCLVAYGHPGVFAYPPHELMRRTRAEGIRSFMLPAVSAEDCLFADLGIDPATCGCQSFEATDFLLSRRRYDPTSALILWQFGITGKLTYTIRRNVGGVRLLAQSLGRVYGPRHKVVIYEAAIYPICRSQKDEVELRRLANARYSPMSTLFVPPMKSNRYDALTARRLGI